MKTIIILLFLFITCSAQSKYFVSYDSLNVARIDSLILAGMEKDYHTSGNNYSIIHKDSVTSRYWIGIDDNDMRNPLNYLDEVQKAMLVPKSYMIEQRLINDIPN